MCIVLSEKASEHLLFADVVALAFGVLVGGCGMHISALVQVGGGLEINHAIFRSTLRPLAES